MIIAIDGKGIQIGGSLREILSQACFAINKALEQGEISDKDRFNISLAICLGPDRLYKLMKHQDLDPSINAMTDELWNAVEVVEKYLDDYKATDNKDNNTNIDE